MNGFQTELKKFQDFVLTECTEDDAREYSKVFEAGFSAAIAWAAENVTLTVDGEDKGAEHSYYDYHDNDHIVRVNKMSLIEAFIENNGTNEE